MCTPNCCPCILHLASGIPPLILFIHHHVFLPSHTLISPFFSSPLPLSCVFVKCCSMSRDRINADTNSCSLKVTRNLLHSRHAQTHTETHAKPPTFTVKASVLHILPIKHEQLQEMHHAQSLLHSFHLSRYIFN